ncbi:hypothetical protein H9P43_009341 [Blastocladiella emersonii ATCC 22665]|nr:hypothetical protein H9P43_009341 [Blastocladiella emersonii ATCC 22665]
MERVRLPPAFIEFYMTQVLREDMGRKLYHGRGIPQGVVETDLLWELLYDVCLSELCKLAVEVKNEPSLSASSGFSSE